MRFLMFLSLTIPLSLYSQQPPASTLAPMQNTETPRYVLVTASVPAGNFFCVRTRAMHLDSPRPGVTLPGAFQPEVVPFSEIGLVSRLVS